MLGTRPKVKMYCFISSLTTKKTVTPPRVTKVIILFKQKNIWSEMKFNAEIH